MVYIQIRISTFSLNNLNKFNYMGLSCCFYCGCGNNNKKQVNICKSFWSLWMCIAGNLFSFFYINMTHFGKRSVVAYIYKWLFVIDRKTCWNCRLVWVCVFFENEFGVWDCFNEQIHNSKTQTDFSLFISFLSLSLSLSVSVWMLLRIGILISWMYFLVASYFHILFSLFRGIGLLSSLKFLSLTVSVLLFSVCGSFCYWNYTHNLLLLLFIKLAIINMNLLFFLFFLFLCIWLYVWILLWPR